MRLHSHDTYSGLAVVAKALASPFRRLEEDVHAGGWCAASIAATCQFLTSDAFFVALWLSIAASAWDYFAGVRLAKHRGTYSSQLAHAGWMGKVSGIVLLMLVRVLEAWVTRFVGFDSHGYIATALGVGLVIAEFRSIVHNRAEWGAQPIPVLGQLLDFFDSLSASLIPAKRPTQEELAARAARTAETRVPTPQGGAQ
jgi:hypothetical protein